MGIILMELGLELIIEDNKSLLQKKKAQVILQDLENKDFISLIKGINDDELIILNIIILNRKIYLEKIFLNNNLDKNIIMAVSNIGYNNNKLIFY